MDLDYHDIEWFALKMNRDHSVVFEVASKYCISDSFVDYDGYSISPKGFLSTAVDIMVIWVNSPIPVHLSSVIPRMSMFTLAISYLTTSNLPDSYSILLFTASDLASITSHIHSCVCARVHFLASAMYTTCSCSYNAVLAASLASLQM